MKLAAAGPAVTLHVLPRRAQVMAVRRMRGERDELRRRDAKTRAQVATLKESLKVGRSWGQPQQPVVDIKGRTEARGTGQHSDEGKGA